MQQSSATPKKSRCREGVAEDCCMLSILLAVPSCTHSFWHGVIPTSYFIFNDFYTCFTIFYAGLASYIALLGLLNHSGKGYTLDNNTPLCGWMVIQRRLPNGTVNFTRCWSDYENGFGDLDGEFWYGLKNIHYLTTRDDVELRVDMVKADDGTEQTWTYHTFRVADVSDNDYWGETGIWI